MFAAVATPGRAIVLDSALFCESETADRLPPGFSNVLEHSRWASADPNVHGFAGDPAAIVISYSAPTLFAPHKRNVVYENTFALPQIGLEGTLSFYYLLNSRRMMGCNFDLHGRSTGRPERLEVAHVRMTISVPGSPFCAAARRFRHAGRAWPVVFSMETTGHFFSWPWTCDNHGSIFGNGGPNAPMGRLTPREHDPAQHTLCSTSLVEKLAGSPARPPKARKKDSAENDLDR